MIKYFHKHILEHLESKAFVATKHLNEFTTLWPKIDHTLSWSFLIDTEKNAISSDKLVIFKKADKQDSEGMGIWMSPFWWQD